MDKINNERQWHNEFYKGGATPEESVRSFILPAYVALEYPRFVFKKLQLVSSIKVLDIGCGRGLERANSFILNNCSYTGIDISEECINANINDATMKGINATFIVEDANTMSSLKGQKFDLIILTGTLHHLELDQALSVMKELTDDVTGKVIMLEPMGTNPLINLFRKLTPKLRSPDEHPLTFKDLDLIRNYFPGTKYELHTLTALFTIPIGMIPLRLTKRLTRSMSLYLGRLDKLLGKVPFLNRFSWNVIIEAKP